MVAAQSYVERYGLPRDETDLKNHWFVGTTIPKAGRRSTVGFCQWFRPNG